MTAFSLRPNKKFSTQMSQAVNDTISTDIKLYALPANIPCLLILEPGTANEEKVKVTAKTSDSVTVVRNFDAKGAFTHGFNATVVDYNSPEYITTIADLLDQNFNSDNTPLASRFLFPDFAATLGNFVSSGLTIPVPSPVSLTATIALGTIYWNGIKVTVPSDTGHTYIASKDTYVDVSSLGAFTYGAVNNGAAAPALTANSIRIAKLVTDGTKVTTVVQAGSDSLGNPIYPNKPTASVTTGRSRAYSSVDQTGVPTGLNTKVTLDLETYDLGSNFASSRFTAPVSGYYSVTGSVGYGSPTSGKRYFSQIFKNGSAAAQSASHANSGVTLIVQVNDILSLAAGDYIELYTTHDVGSNQVVSHDQTFTYLTVNLLSV